MKIFIVEDDPLYAEILRANIAKQKDVEVEVYSNGASMVDNMFKNPEVVFLDYFLEEDMDGLDVLRQIKGFNPNISVIFISGQDKTEVAIESLKFGAVDYIVKNEESIAKAIALLDKIREVNKALKKKTLGKWMQRLSPLCLLGVLPLINYILF